MLLTPYCRDASAAEWPATSMRLIALDWYDGPTIGVITCSACRNTLRFWLLAWNEGTTQRVFAFEEVDFALYEAVRATCEQYAVETTPSWYPAASVEERRRDEFEDRALGAFGVSARIDWLGVAEGSPDRLKVAQRSDAPEFAALLSHVAMTTNALQPGYLFSTVSFEEWSKLLEPGKSVR